MLIVKIHKGQLFGNRRNSYNERKQIIEHLIPIWQTSLKEIWLFPSICSIIHCRQLLPVYVQDFLQIQTATTFILMQISIEKKWPNKADNWMCVTWHRANLSTRKHLHWHHTELKVQQEKVTVQERELDLETMKNKNWPIRPSSNFFFFSCFTFVCVCRSVDIYLHNHWYYQ